MRIRSASFGSRRSWAAAAVAVLACSLILLFVCCHADARHAETGSSATACAGGVHDVADHRLGADLLGGLARGSGGPWLLLQLITIVLAAAGLRISGWTAPASRRRPPTRRAVHIDLCVARS